MKKCICIFLFCMLPILSYGGELLNFKEIYASEFTQHYEEIETADLAWKEGDLEKAWLIYSSISESVEHPLFQSGLFLKKALIAHELGLEKETEENTLSFIKPFLTEAGLEINESDYRMIIESTKNSIIKNAEKFKELLFAIYESLEEE